MKITIEAEPKEIADLIVALQDQHISKAVFKVAAPRVINGNDLKKYIGNAISTSLDALGSANCDTAPKGWNMNDWLIEWWISIPFHREITSFHHQYQFDQ